jgi:DNA-binding LacI/PurR family transcriptional regulator/DNA-binding transcriptional regulator YhcF (GntR family)
METHQVDDNRGAQKGDLSYKYQRLRERLRLAVKNGELCGKLPGERELARRYSANAKTINKALNDLAMEGLVLRHVGRGTYVTGSGPNRQIPAMPSRKFAWIAPAVDQADGKVLLAIASDLLQARGHHMEVLDGQLDEFGELPDALLTPRILRQIDGVLIVGARPSRELLANLRRRHLPVVLINNHHADIRLPTVLADQSHGAFAITERCIQLGHRRIQMLLRTESLPAGSAAQAGHHAAMQYYGLRPLPPLQVDASFDWSSVIAGEHRPTALVCLSGQLAADARQQMIEAGLDLPAQMSIAAICGPGESCAERDGITGYASDPRRIFHWATEFIISGTPSNGPQLAIVPGKCTDRGSIAPPAERPSASANPTGEATF